MNTDRHRWEWEVEGPAGWRLKGKDGEMGKGGLEVHGSRLQGEREFNAQQPMGRGSVDDYGRRLGWTIFKRRARDCPPYHGWEGGVRLLLLLAHLTAALNRCTYSDTLTRSCFDDSDLERGW